MLPFSSLNGIGSSLGNLRFDNFMLRIFGVWLGVSKLPVKDSGVALPSLLHEKSNDL